MVAGAMTTPLGEDYRRVGDQLGVALGWPKVDGLYLPAPVADETFRDEFGFVFLADGSVGPFYVSMDGILQTLWERYPDPERFQVDARVLLRGFSAGDISDRALAVGAYNALSAAVFRASGFEAPDRAPSSGLSELPAGAKVGMVGYFCPLIDKLTERGCSVLVLEQAPQRVDDRPGVSVTRDPVDLRTCAHVLCTAATLINDTLDDILVAVAGHAEVELIGPTGSGLPDPLFGRGVVSVGGVRFADRTALLECLGRNESWGAAGRKYQLTPASYPGWARLLQMIES